MKPQLVRDNIPEILEKNGKKAFFKPMSNYSIVSKNEDIQQTFTINKINETIYDISITKCPIEVSYKIADLMEIIELFFDSNIINELAGFNHSMFTKKVHLLIIHHNLHLQDLILIKDKFNKSYGSYKKGLILITIYE